MSLLYRIAISQGDQTRKAEANEVIAVIEQGTVSNWNKSLQAEIRLKTRECFSQQPNWPGVEACTSFR